MRVSTKPTPNAQFFGKDWEGKIHKKDSTFYNLINQLTLPLSAFWHAGQSNRKYKIFPQRQEQNEKQKNKRKEFPWSGLGLIFLSTAISPIKCAWYVVYRVVGENIKSSKCSRYRLTFWSLINVLNIIPSPIVFFIFFIVKVHLHFNQILLTFSFYSQKSK